MIKALQRACYEAGHLIGVGESPLEIGSALISGVELQFEKLTIAISAVGEDDYLHHRTPQKLYALGNEISPDSDGMHVDSEDQGVNLFLHLPSAR